MKIAEAIRMARLAKRLSQKAIAELVGVTQQAVSDWESRGGVDIRTVAEIMGHRNISQTMRYTHFLDAHRIEAIQAIGGLGK